MKLPQPLWQIAIGLTGAALTFVITLATVDARTDERVISLEKQVPAMEQRLTDRMEQNKEELREDIKELRGLILRKDK